MSTVALEVNSNLLNGNNVLKICKHQKINITLIYIVSLTKDEKLNSSKKAYRLKHRNNYNLLKGPLHNFDTVKKLFLIL